MNKKWTKARQKLPSPLFLPIFPLYTMPTLWGVISFEQVISFCWNFQDNLVSYIIKKSFIKIWDGSCPAFLVHEMTMSCHEMTQFNFLSMMKNVQNLKPHPPIFPSHLKKTSHQMFLLFLFLLYPLTYSFFYLFLILPSISCYSRKCGGRRKIAIK